MEVKLLTRSLRFTVTVTCYVLKSYIDKKLLEPANYQLAVKLFMNSGKFFVL